MDFKKPGGNFENLEKIFEKHLATLSKIYLKDLGLFCARGVIFFIDI